VKVEPKYKTPTPVVRKEVSFVRLLHKPVDLDEQSIGPEQKLYSQKYIDLRDRELVLVHIHKGVYRFPLEQVHYYKE
jgi:hypothetical protein